MGCHIDSKWNICSLVICWPFSSDSETFFATSTLLVFAPEVDNLMQVGNFYRGMSETWLKLEKNFESQEKFNFMYGYADMPS